jgi:hypothetical protein
VKTHRAVFGDVDRLSIDQGILYVQLCKRISKRFEFLRPIVVGTGEQSHLAVFKTRQQAIVIEFYLVYPAGALGRALTRVASSGATNDGGTARALDPAFCFFLAGGERELEALFAVHCLLPLAIASMLRDEPNPLLTRVGGKMNKTQSRVPLGRYPLDVPIRGRRCDDLGHRAQPSIMEDCSDDLAFRDDVTLDLMVARQVENAAVCSASRT